MAKEVRALLGREGVECFGYGLEKLVPCSRGGLTQQGFELGEGHFNGVEVGAVCGEVKKLGPASGNGSLHPAYFVGGDQVAWPQFGTKHLAHVSQEHVTVHRTIHQPRGAQAIVAQCCDEGGAFPVTMRHRRLAALANWRTPVKARHLGVEPGLIEKDQSSCLPNALFLPPILAGDQEVLPVLLGGAQRFFYSSAPSVPNGARGQSFPP